MQTFPLVHSRGRFQTRDDPNFQPPAMFSVPENPKLGLCSGVPRLGFTDFNDSVTRYFQTHHGVFRSQIIGLWWERNLSVAIKHAIKAKVDYIVCLDYDSVFEDKDIDELVKAMQENPQYAAMWATQISRHDERILCHETGLDYSKAIMPKMFGHFGLTIIRREVFENLPKPWFFATPGEDGDWDGNGSIDSDISFWRLMHDHRYLCAQHNKVVIGHLELAVRWPKFNTVQLQPVNEYRKHGKPIDAVWTGRPYNPLPEKTNLFLGEGPIRGPGYILVDDKQGECYPLKHEDNSVGSIRAANVLNRMPYRIRHHAIADWVRVLKPGGVLMITVPNFRKIAAKYFAGECPEVEMLVYGSQETDFAANVSLYEEGVLTKLLSQAGLISIEFNTKLPAENDQFSGWQWLHVCAMKPIEGATGPDWETPAKEWDWLKDDMLNIDAQFGEDSIVQKLVTAADFVNGWCFEVGAGDGVALSNTIWCRQAGWPTVLIEANIRYYEKMKMLGGVTPVLCKIAPTGDNSIDAILDRIGAPEEINFGVIDIDGDDYHVAKAMRRRPKILMIEFKNTHGMPCHRFVPEPGRGQATQPSVVDLGREMGYEFVANTLVNAIFVRNDVAQTIRENLAAPKQVNLIEDGDGSDWSAQDGVLAMSGAD